MFQRVPNHQSFDAGEQLGILKPIVTLEDEQGQYAYIAIVNECYVLFRKKERMTRYRSTSRWFLGAVEAMQMLPLPNQILVDADGNFEAPLSDELPNRWDINSIGEHQYKCVEFYDAGELESRKTTGRQLTVRAISGAQHHYVVEVSEYLPQLIGKRIVFDPTTDKLYTVL